ncbi:MAG: hypothetical protein OEZ02_02990 [Anaerolineae bacterium]|nr:hypothetical protein [Anaerolineae bacterium]
MEGSQNINWDDHILRVFTVLAGITISAAFNVIATKNLVTEDILFSVLVLYIVLDNWYGLTKDLSYFDVVDPSEVIFYLLSLFTYACLPYLFGIRSDLISDFKQPEWMLVNLAMLCLFDAVRKSLTVRRLKKSPNFANNLPEKVLLGSYVFYALSGYFYFLLLFLGTLVLSKSSATIITKVSIVFGIWLLIKTIDVVAIPRTSEIMASIFLKGEPDSG